jgi:transcriptional regulator with XRE-family HTH domain
MKLRSGTRTKTTKPKSTIWKRVKDGRIIRRPRKKLRTSKTLSQLDLSSSTHIPPEIQYMILDAAIHNRMKLDDFVSFTQVNKLWNARCASILIKKPRMLYRWLQDTARFGYLEKMRILLNFQKDINAVFYNDFTLLHISAEYGHLDIVKMLVIEYGARVEALNYRNQTPLMLAANEGHTDVVRILAKEFDARVDIKDTSGYTPLFRAAKYGRIETLKCLVYELGADVDISTNDGSLPLHIAAINGHLEEVKVLTDSAYTHKYNENTRDRYGWTPLHCASQNGHEEVARYLAVDLCVDVNMKDNYSMTP